MSIRFLPSSSENLQADSSSHSTPQQSQQLPAQLNPQSERKHTSIVWVVGPEAVGKKALCESLRTAMAPRGCEVQVLYWPLLMRRVIPEGTSAYFLKSLLEASDAAIVSCLHSALSPLLLKNCDCALLCNFPINLHQALIFTKLVRIADLILALSASERVLLARMQARGKDVRRKQLLAKMSEHNRKLGNIICHFENIVVGVDTDKPLETVTNEVRVLLQERGLIHIKERRPSPAALPTLPLAFTRNPNDL